ncbi:MAG: hypothetical protein MZV65_41210 [Chromatiales bacterium]|nr:hypothetical protein [Chromatiales bacterium]
MTFEGDLALAYRACLWSRVANRVLLPLAQFPAPTPEALYAGVRCASTGRRTSDRTEPWRSISIACRSAITHTHYGALKVKDAIVDQFRERSGVRPSVATDEPDVRINVYRARAIRPRSSLDLSGESLHRRGYRGDSGRRRRSRRTSPPPSCCAPAGRRSPQPGGALVDLMCGSGTLPIEAALIAADSAPGLGRTYYGFLRWRGHDAAVWEHAAGRGACAARGRPHERCRRSAATTSDPAAMRAALANVERAGLTGHVHIERRDLADCRAEHVERAGLVVANPPYGERLGEESELPGLYRDARRRAASAAMSGWRAAVFTGNPGARQGDGPARAQAAHALQRRHRMQAAALRGRRRSGS